mgnify:CR=1 FL=1
MSRLLGRTGQPIPAGSSKRLRRDVAPRNLNVTIHVLAVPHDGDIHDQYRVADFINHAVISHANPPETIFSLEFKGTGGPGIGRERCDAVKDTFSERRRELLQFLAGGRANVIV